MSTISVPTVWYHEREMTIDEYCDTRATEDPDVPDDTLGQDFADLWAEQGERHPVRMCL